MLSDKRKAAVLLIAMTLLGVVLGVGGTVFAAHQGVGDLHYHERRGPRGPQEYFDWLAKELELEPAQRDSVNAILEQQRTGIDGIWREMNPRFEALRRELRVDIRAILTTEQQVRFDEITQKNDQRRNRGNSR